MKRAPRKNAPRVRGSVAVEAAIILPMLSLLVTALLFFCWIFWHYTVAEKAAHDATRFLAAASAREMQPNSGGAEVPVVAVAQRIVAMETAELNPGGGIATRISCFVGDSAPYWDGCFGFSRPKRVMVRVTVSISDPFFDALLGAFTAGQPIVLTTVVVTDYAGS